MKLSLSTALIGAATTTALETITATGSKFFYENGTQFYIKGVAYQLTEHDPLIDGNQCTLDASLMKSLGANTIRVYHVDAQGDHSECMETFANAGIYTIIDLDTFNTYILPNTPWWNQTQYDADANGYQYAAVMDAFANYTNVLGFFVGNEVIAQANQSQAAPYIKAAARDMKAYRDSKGYRTFPVGYSAADIAELRPYLQDYLTCGGNASENVDFFSLNSYEWCDPSTYDTSGYANLETDATNFPVPIFFSETGCNAGTSPRLFDDQAAIFGSDMVNDWSGAIIYEWIEEANNYGLISYGPTVAATATASDVEGGFSRAGTPTAIAPDFTNLQQQWATLNPTGVASTNYNPTSVSTRACPTSTLSGWLVDGNVALPTLGQTYSGTYTSSPSASGSTTATSTAAASASATNNPAPRNKDIAGMSAGLVGVMLIFTVWL